MWRIIGTVASGVLITGIVAVPGVAQTPWTDLPVTAGLAVQFNAGLGVTLDANNRVSGWNSAYWNTASQLAASQTTAAYRPEVVADVWNGHAAIRFNAVDNGSGQTAYIHEKLTSDYTPALTIPGTTDPNPSNYGHLSVFVVAKQSGLLKDPTNQGSGIRWIVGSGGPDTGNGLFTIEHHRDRPHNAELATHRQEYVNFSGSVDFGDNAAILGVVLDYSYNPLDASGKYRVDFGAYYSGVLGLAGPWQTDFRPGLGVLGIGGDPLATNRGFSGDIAEVIVFETALSGAQRILVENHLSSKYAIPFGSAATGNDFYHGETGVGGDTGLKFDAGVFGVGRMADGSSEVLASTGATGVRFAAPSLPDGMWLLAGHNDGAHGWNTDSFYARWNREWAVEFTHDQNDQATFDLVFDFDSAGLILDPEEGYGLMFKQNYADPWDFVLTSYTIDGNSLAFSGIPMGDTGGHGLGAGYFTLGIVPEPSTMLLLCLALLGLSGRGRR